jgi:hypothetical protein
VNTWFAFTWWRRATVATEAPRTCVSSTIRRAAAKTHSRAEAQVGFIQAVDGRVEVTEPKRLLTPVSWYKWALSGGRFESSKRIA